MSSLINVKLSRFDGSPWGFRLQGGKDFGQPLVIQKVAGGSLAEKAGLQAGDAVIKVNNTDLFNLRHKEAQDSIVRAGNTFELTVQRGGGTWKPQVTPVGSMHKPNASAPISNIQPVTKTSLAARKTESAPIGSGHNLSAKPFGSVPQVNGSEPTVKAIVNKQYNTPVGMYSEETIAETLSAQAEVLAGGVLGVNFKKNERNYDSAKSEVFKMIQEIDKEPHEPEPDPEVNAALGSRATGGVYPLVGLRHVSAPETKAPSSDQPSSPYAVPKTSLPPGQNICADCERLIVGVFVRIKDKNLHVECFKCATCGTSLKNVGYYNINSKLYCDIHAKLVARHHPPAPNLEPVTVPPGGKAPAGAISAAIAHSMASPGGPGTPTPLATAPLSPQPGTMAPLPFHAPRVGTSHVHAPRSIAQSAAPSAPKPFSSVSAPAPSTSVSRPTSGYYTTLKPSMQGYRTVAAPNRVIWPPVRSEEEEKGTPTACPIYHPPNDNKPASQEQSAAAPSSAPPPSTPSYAPIQAPSAPVKPTLAPASPRPAAVPPPATQPSVPPPSAPSSGPSGAPKGATFAGASAPRRGRGILNPQAGPGVRVPLCGQCGSQIRGPFITALGKTWCPDHFVCVKEQCRRPLQDIGFVEEQGQLYCEYCFEKFLAPVCNKCKNKIKGDCLNAIGQHFHPECFSCAYCGKLFGNNPFFLEEGLPYCENDWNELFTTKCFACGFPIEAGDRWVEALNNNYHSQCFNCSMCKKNLEGQSFYAKSGRPYCKNHAR